MSTARTLRASPPARRGQAQRLREAELQAQWGAGAWLGWTLVGTDGGAYTIVFQGRPGGPAGPDFRDAVLQNASGARITGDIELHLRPSGWGAHGHGADPRYNGLALHVTLTGGRQDVRSGSQLASGRMVPLVVLADQRREPPPGRIAPSWPCDAFAGRAPSERLALLTELGSTRFEERVSAHASMLQSFESSGDADARGWSAVDRALVVALAEGLGYGRDRMALRECGERLAAGAAPDALLTTVARSAQIERRRLAGLLALMERWGARGPFTSLAGALTEGASRAGGSGAARALTAALVVGESGAISQGRARILAFNVALPCIAAWAGSSTDEGARELGVVARAAAQSLASLPSNQITREMTRQLRLPRAPTGALAQQGLHHIWASACREKRCDRCPCVCR